MNHVLLEEARGKGFTVFNSVKRRIAAIGGRVVESAKLTRQDLQAMMKDTEQMRLLVHQLMTVGS